MWNKCYAIFFSKHSHFTVYGMRVCRLNKYTNTVLLNLLHMRFSVVNSGGLCPLLPWRLQLVHYLPSCPLFHSIFSTLQHSHYSPLSVRQRMCETEPLECVKLFNFGISENFLAPKKNTTSSHGIPQLSWCYSSHHQLYHYWFPFMSSSWTFYIRLPTHRVSLIKAETLQNSTTCLIIHANTEWYW